MYTRVCVTIDPLYLFSSGIRQCGNKLRQCDKFRQVPLNSIVLTRSSRVKKIMNAKREEKYRITVQNNMNINIDWTYTVVCVFV